MKTITHVAHATQTGMVLLPLILKLSALVMFMLPLCLQREGLISCGCWPLTEGWSSGKAWFLYSRSVSAPFWAAQFWVIGRSSLGSHFLFGKLTSITNQLICLLWRFIKIIYLTTFLVLPLWTTSSLVASWIKLMTHHVDSDLCLPAALPERITPNQTIITSPVDPGFCISKHCNLMSLFTFFLLNTNALE